MAVEFDPKEDLGVDLRVGNGIECTVLVWLYDENGRVIPGDLPGTTAMFEIWADDDDAPEYVIPRTVLAGHEKLKLVQKYFPGLLGPGTFGSTTIFIQDDAKPQIEFYEATSLKLGDTPVQRIDLVRS